MSRILGIDPGTQVTGWGVLDYERGESRFVEQGTIRLGQGPMIGRLDSLFTQMRDIVMRLQPEHIAIESAFVHRNPDSALKLGQARAAALCATFDLERAAFDYSPTEVKKAVVGTGRATKAQVQHMVIKLLGLTEELTHDASDALAIAICHAHSSDLKRKLGAGVKRRRTRWHGTGGIA
jgi:crossover junction endodeoxyribonuclease RuvC